jgi:hypothetical protein
MKPLLLVHGIVSNARHTYGTPGFIAKEPKIGGMYSFLLSQGYRPGETLFWFSYNTLSPILRSARRLKQEIEKVRVISGSKEIDLLTFSLGGIISKYYVVSPLYQDEINKMIMIAPPFLGSPRADFFKIEFFKNRRDLFLPGDSRALTPTILGLNHPFLTELAGYSFPGHIQTTIIAMKLNIDESRHPFQGMIATWIGAGDQTVPVQSTKIAVNRHYIVEDEYTPEKVHGFLPNHEKIQKIVIQELSRDKG